MSRNRFHILDDLTANWRGQIDMAQIQFFERRLREYTPEEMEAAVNEVLETCTYPPRLKDLISGCKKARARHKERDRAKARRARDKKAAGQEEESMEPKEALAEWKKMVKEHPEAFGDRPYPKKDGLGKLDKEWLNVMALRGRRLWLEGQVRRGGMAVPAVPKKKQGQESPVQEELFRG